MKLTVYWDVEPCSLAEIDRRFRYAYYLHYQGDDDWGGAVRTSETSVNFYELYGATSQQTVFFNSHTINKFGGFKDFSVSELRTFDQRRIFKTYYFLCNVPVL
jgi:hypothetical protein